VTTAFFGGDGSKLGVPYGTGIEKARKLAAHCDVVVVWGIDNLAQILPADRPRVIAVHHADWTSDWSNQQILNQLDLLDEVICVNRETASKLSSCGKPAHHVANAIDPDRLVPSGNQIHLRTQFSIPEESKVVLFGHRLSAEKRPTLAIDIARHLPHDWTMVIAGEGPELANTRAMAATRSNVRVVGAPDSLADWLSVSDCFLSLSTFEGFGLSIAEAMAAGVSTVSTPAGIAPGLATTLPVDSTAAEWAQAIVSAKAIVPAEFVLEQFSVERMVDAWAEILKTSTP
jgi:glycosyltransferase involved in cell wall biosynthesis